MCSVYVYVVYVSLQCNMLYIASQTYILYNMLYSPLSFSSYKFVSFVHFVVFLSSLSSQSQ